MNKIDFFLKSKKVTFNFIYYFLLIISGILWGLGQWPNFFFIRFFGLIPFLFIIFYRKHYLLETIIFGTIAYSLNFYWLYFTFYESGKIHPVVSVLIILVLCLYYSLQYPLIAIIYKKFCDFDKKRLFYTLPIIFVTIDSTFFKLFKHSIADSQIVFTYFVQLIDITGMTGLILIIMVVNLGLFNILERLLNTKPIYWKHFIFILPFVLSIFYGIFRINQLEKEMNNCPTVLGAMIQGNITGKQKLDENYFKTNVERYNSLTKEATKNESPDIIIWPESIFNKAYHGNQDFIEKVIFENYPPLILGIVVWLPDNKITNSALLIEKKKVLAQYDKQVLLMFGEYVPFEKNFPFLRYLTPLRSNTSPGKTSSIFTIKNINAALTICFEDLFPDLVRKKVNEGAKIMINLTNDSWYGNTIGPIHHSIIARLRAIENRRSFFRCTATGFTTATDFTGKVIASGKMFSEDIVKAKLPLYSKKTIYSYIGELFTYISILSVIIISIYIFAVYFKNNRKNRK